TSAAPPNRTFHPSASWAAVGRLRSKADAAGPRTSPARSDVRESFRQVTHDLDQVGLPLEADARQLRHGDTAVLDAYAIREAAIGLEEIGVALVAAQTESCGDVERHLVAAMRNAARRRPAGDLQHGERALVFAEPV